MRETTSFDVLIVEIGAGVLVVKEQPTKNSSADEIANVNFL